MIPSSYDHNFVIFSTEIIDISVFPLAQQVKMSFLLQRFRKVHLCFSSFYYHVISSSSFLVSGLGGGNKRGRRRAMERGFLETPSPLIFMANFWRRPRSTWAVATADKWQNCGQQRPCPRPQACPHPAQQGPLSPLVGPELTASSCLQREDKTPRALRKAWPVRVPKLTLHHHQDTEPSLSQVRHVLVQNLPLSKGRLLNTQISGSSLWILFRIWGRAQTVFLITASGDLYAVVHFRHRALSPCNSISWPWTF